MPNTETIPEVIDRSLAHISQYARGYDNHLKWNEVADIHARRMQDRRVVQRHPELSEQDVLDAWDSCIRALPRLGGDALDYAAVGVDSRGRLVEMVARILVDDSMVVYHAQTPPTKKLLRELGMTRR